MKRQLVVTLLFLSAACGGQGDPFAGSGGAGTTGDSGAGAGMGGATSSTGGASTGPSAGGAAPPPLGTGGAAPPATSGRPRPARLIVLGDSLSACSNVGGKTAADCSLKKLYDYLKATYAPALTYENEGVGAAVTVDVPARQITRIKPGPGHALVLIYVGGNDLAKYIFSTDTAASAGLTSDLPKVLGAWGEIFAYFTDRGRFPDGVTMLMNNQYNPFDDCTAAPYFISAKKGELLGVFNGELGRLARERAAVLVDQYTPFLGHGHHYEVKTCAHYLAGADGWMDDLIHPNPAGHTNLFEQWKKAVDRLYAGP